MDRSITPWIVVSGHRPLYISDYHSDRVKLSGLQKVCGVRVGTRDQQPPGLAYRHGVQTWGQKDVMLQSFPELGALRALGMASEGTAQGDHRGTLCSDAVHKCKHFLGCLLPVVDPKGVGAPVGPPSWCSS